jgi:AcrR family transcriptional regulator
MARAQGLRDQKKVATWRSINAAATRLFLDRGYEAVSVEAIAAAAKVSPSTFFNYFPTKEAVVFDPDPEDALAVRELLAARPAGEAMWTSLSEVLIAYVVALGPRVVTQKRLKSASPALASCGRALGDRIREGLETWGAERHSEMSPLQSSLLINLAVTALLTAYEAWDPDSGVAELTATARNCLDRVAHGTV